MDLFGLSFEKLLIIGVIAVFLLGPDKLPGYAAKLGQFVRTLRGMADTAKARMRDEMGPEFDEVEWQKLDPRQYDPRRIIRDALVDVPEAQRRPAPSAAVAGAAAGAAGSVVPARREVVPLAAGEVAPYDSEAT